MTKDEGQTLASVVPLLGEAYRNWKTWEGAKNSHKDAFFACADAELAQGLLRVKGVFDISAASEADARAYVERHYPEWNIDVLRPHGVKADNWEAVLKENPAYMRFSFDHDGIRYIRTVSKGTTMIDDEWLLADDPELHELVTYELPWGQRITRPIETLDKAVLGKLTKYIYNTKPRPSLAAPRAIKAETE